ncbi:MAG: hypothetical protein R2818_07460 [Flavobacteriales bacterium]
MIGRILLLGSIILASCSPKGSDTRFNMLFDQEQNEHGVAVIDMDYTDALDSGFVVPSIRQVPDGRFSFRYSATSADPQSRATDTSSIT